MFGKKRRNISMDSNSDANPFQSQRLAPESHFGTPVPAAAIAPLPDRRKAARQHVRALNTEFARWVQSQLQDHPDELWEDGVRDYITHSSDILEKFTDVVNWLKTNIGTEGCVPTLGTQNFEKKNGPEILGTQNIEKKNGPETISKEKSVPVKSFFGVPSNDVGLTSSSKSGASSIPSPVQGATTGSGPSWSFGLSASSQALSQSSSAGLATSWNPGAFSTNKLVSPTKEVGASFSPSSGVSSSNQTALPMSASSFMSSTSSGLFSTSLTPSFSTTPSFTTPWSAGAFANSQTTFTFGGSQTSAPSTNNTQENADEDDEPEQPSSPSLKKSEEKGIVVVHETKCKLFLKSTDPADKEPWKDKGIGQLYIKCEEGASKGTKESKPRILVRNDVGRIMLNASLYAGIKTNLQKNAIVAIFHTLDGSAGEDGSAKPVARTFLIRIKNEEERNKLADAIREHAPAA